MEQVNKIIKKFIDDNITPKIDDISMIAEKYEKVGKILGATTLFQSGSYPRNTAIRPVNDLDIIKILPYGKSFDDAGKVLQEVHAMLNTQESKKQLGYDHLVIQKTSIGIFFRKDEEKFSIDVVPAIETDKKDIIYGTKIYQVPEIQQMNKRRRVEFYKNANNNDNRIYSAPKAYITYAQYSDEISDNNFRYFIRFIKKRKRGRKEQYNLCCLKSFHLEQIVGEIVKGNTGLHIQGLVVLFFEKINDIVCQGKRFKDFAYAGIPGEERYIDEYIQDPQKNTSEFREHLRIEVIRVKSLIAKIRTGVDEETVDLILKQILREQKMEEPKIVNNAPKGPRLGR